MIVLVRKIMAEILCSLSISSHKSSFCQNKPHQMWLHSSVLSNQANVFDACLTNHGGLFKHFLTSFSLFYTFLCCKRLTSVRFSLWDLFLPFTWQLEILVTVLFIPVLNIFPLANWNLSDRLLISPGTTHEKCSHFFVPHMNTSTFIFMHEMFILFSQ